jgi:transcriptional regulator with XRE-family HTH domain
LSTSEYILSTNGFPQMGNLAEGVEPHRRRIVGTVTRQLKKSEDTTIAGRIKLAMAAVGISTPSELARRMKASRQTVHNYVSGQRDNPEPALLFKLADALNVNPRWLALGHPHSPGLPVTVTPEEAETLEIRRALDDQAREQWLSNGRTMVRLTTKASAGNPFGKRIKA